MRLTRMGFRVGATILRGKVQITPESGNRGVLSVPGFINRLRKPPHVHNTFKYVPLGTGRGALSKVHVPHARASRRRNSLQLRRRTGTLPSNGVCVVVGKSLQASVTFRNDRVLYRPGNG